MSTRLDARRHGREGFTIVELIIVIIVIGILATIVGINYQSATKTARLSQAKANAYSVQKVAESFYADKNRVPGKVSDFSVNPLSKIPEGVTLLTGSQSLKFENGQTSIDYEFIGDPASATGARIVYWDYETAAPTATPVYIGTASASSTNFQPL